MTATTQLEQAYEELRQIAYDLHLMGPPPGYIRTHVRQLIARVGDDTPDMTNAALRRLLDMPDETDIDDMDRPEYVDRTPGDPGLLQVKIELLDARGKKVVLEGDGEGGVKIFQRSIFNTPININDLRHALDRIGNAS